MKQAEQPKNRTFRSRLFSAMCYILVGILWTLACALTVLAMWYQNTFSMDFNELLFTLLSPLGGTGVSTIEQILTACLPPVIVLVLVYVGFCVGLRFRTAIYRRLRRIGAILCAVALLVSSVYAINAFRIPKYIAASQGSTDLYENYYVDPDSVSITDADGNLKNLIYIYVESMETTYASKDVGGAQPVDNYMPRLTQLAEEHLSFSETDALGGFHSITGTGWTMGALMGTTSGVPFSLSVFGENSHNSLGKDGNFVNGLTALGDILEEKGYVQEFLCGSDGGFAGRNTYFTQHGNYKIFDYYTAIEEGYIAEDYKVWWGYEDEILFEIAKDEVRELANGNQPFNFTMLTVDTHHVGGYRCDSCGNTYDTKLKNVIACSDRLVSDFVEWCLEQEFAKDSVIVVTGDHPRMDTQLVKETDFYHRTIYNCFIQADAEVARSATNRIFTSLDIFPTVLAAMGYKIEGNRLGLGTNLFSTTPTLAEAYGYEWLEAEIAKYSSYYEENFS